jgi:antitoxin (DNA-binding transcriptional repressor) of toxin-antitoxin stability system
MIKLNVHEAKTHLSKYLDRIQKGETVILCRRNEPIAEIRPLPPRRQEKRPLGEGIGTVVIEDGFFEDLPPEILAGFEGKEP